jgi:hypothetical protein
MKYSDLLIQSQKPKPKEKKNSNFYNQTDTNMRDQQIELHLR